MEKYFSALILCCNNPDLLAPHPNITVACLISQIPTRIYIIYPAGIISVILIFCDFLFELHCAAERVPFEWFDASCESQISPLVKGRTIVRAQGGGN